MIDREYIGRGMRMRAQEIATDWLGPRTDREIQASRHQELVADRVTPLDRALHREAVDGVIDLRQIPATPSARQAHALKFGRLAHLAKLGLAEESRPGRWQLTEESYLVVQGIDSRAHYLRPPGKVNLTEFPVGGIVQTQGRRLVLVSALRNRELAAVGSQHAPRTGMTDRHVPDGKPGTGVYLRSVQLVSGRYALLGDGMNFSLVPWRRELERGVQRGITMDGPGRGRGIGR